MNKQIGIYNDIMQHNAYASQAAASNSVASNSLFKHYLTQAQSQGSSVSSGTNPSMMAALALSSVSGESSGGFYNNNVEDILTSILLYLLMEQNGHSPSSSDISSLFTSGSALGGGYQGAATAAPSLGAAFGGAPFTPLPAYANGEYNEIVQSALTRLGDPYSQSKAGQGDYTDCSYLSRWCYREIGVEIPRTAAAQAKYCMDNGMTIHKEELQPGDLIFFSLHQNNRFMDITHVGIYAGRGMMVDASSNNGAVVYRPVFEGQVLYGRPR